MIDLKSLLSEEKALGKNPYFSYKVSTLEEINSEILQMKKVEAKEKEDKVKLSKLEAKRKKEEEAKLEEEKKAEIIEQKELLKQAKEKEPQRFAVDSVITSVGYIAGSELANEEYLKEKARKEEEARQKAQQKKLNEITKKEQEEYDEYLRLKAKFENS